MVIIMPKIIFIGGFGYHDIGDEAQLTTPLINLRESLPDAQFLVLSDDPEYTAESHKVETDCSIRYYLFPKTKNIFLRVLRKFGFDTWLRGAILLFNAQRLRENKKTILLNEQGQKLLNNLKSADLLFNVGGGNLNSVFRSEFHAKCFTHQICKIFGCPVILSGQTIGPFNNWIDKKLARFTLNKVEVITLRDITSKNVLKDTGIVKPIIKETADDAMLLPCATHEEIKTVFLNEKIDGNERPLIGINMLGLGYFSDTKLNKAKQILAQVSDYLISKYNAETVFIPMHYVKGASDIAAMSEVLGLMEHKDKARIIMNEYDDKILKGIIGKMDLVIGLRYHFIVFATTMCVPSIGIYLDQYYSMKIKGILELMGQEKYACDIEKTSAIEIIELVEDALRNKDKIKKRLEERTKVLEERSLFTIEYAVKLLRGGRQ